MTKQWVRDAVSNELDSDFAGGLDAFGNWNLGTSAAPHTDATLLHTMADSVIWCTVNNAQGHALTQDWFQYQNFVADAVRTDATGALSSDLTTEPQPDVVGTGMFRLKLFQGPNIAGDLVMARWELDSIDSEGQRKVITPGTTPGLALAAIPILGFPLFDPTSPYVYALGFMSYIRTLWEW